MSSWALGIDIGGTFTDLVVHDEATGEVRSYKELTTPANPTEGVLTGIRALFAREGIQPSQVGRVVHATTLFTNALIERKGAATALITTKGFRDVLEIGTERKFELYDIFIQMPEPLIRRSLRFEVSERLAPDGSVEIPLSEAELIEAGRKMVAKGIESVAIVFLHAFMNPAHEEAARDLLAEEFPGLSISISSEVSPEIREFERTSTTVANAYVKPLASSYLMELERRIEEMGIGAEIFLMLSNGGLTNMEEAKRVPVQLLESGPAAGALSAAFFGARSDRHSLLAFDMGGTTAKLAVIDDGEPMIAYKFEAAREKRFKPGSGLPINITTIELLEIGAGGGSIAGLDQIGLLKVGPRSAGASPGPACYGRGGTEPTVTDANLVLGYLDADSFAGGTIKISRQAAEASLDPLAKVAGIDRMALAWGIHDVVNENMAGAARMHIAEHGKDPRSYALLTTGGGGPLHGCEVARKLGIAEVICPPSAGVASANGLLVAPARVDRSVTVARALRELDWSRFEAAFRQLETDGRRVIAETGLDPAQAAVTRFADMRYIGQGFELVVELPPGPYSQESLPRVLERFEEEYRRIFLRSPRSEAEVINIRVSVQASSGAHAVSFEQPGAAAGRDARIGSRPVYFGGVRRQIDTPVYERALLGAGSEIDGPAIIEEPVSTLVVPPDARAIIQPNGNVLTRLGGL